MKLKYNISFLITTQFIVWKSRHGLFRTRKLDVIYHAIIFLGILWSVNKSDFHISMNLCNMVNRFSIHQITSRLFLNLQLTCCITILTRMHAYVNEWIGVIIHDVFLWKQPKVEQYWPEKGSPRVFGDYRVVTTNVQTFAVFTVRTMELHDKMVFIILFYLFDAVCSLICIIFYITLLP